MSGSRVPTPSMISVRWIAAALVLAAGCLSKDALDEKPMNDPNAGLLRDFLDGKFDSAGHPLNARVTEAETMCPSAGSPHDGAIRLKTSSCTGALAGGEQVGDMVVSLRLSVLTYAASGRIVTADLYGTHGELLATNTLTTSRLRSSGWVDLPLKWNSDGSAVNLQVTPADGAVVDFDYAEVFPERFGLVASPGSGVFVDADHLVFEVPRSHKLDKIKLDGGDITERMTDLLTSGVAKRTNTAYRTLIEVAVGDLAKERMDRAELELRSSLLAARMQMLRDVTPCKFEGDASGIKVLVTGFQPFPADGWHDNVSGVAVTALDPSALRNAAVMRVVLPVEYDRAAAEIAEIISRCEPRVVISFGQGGGAIALEEVAYNLQDTGEVAGGVPDNRGIIRAAAQIDAAAPATRDTLLPLDAINDALVALGEAPQHSRDPGRYICNNVMFANIGAMASRGVGGFIHLPYTTAFDDGTRARYGKVVQSAIQATVDSL